MSTVLTKSFPYRNVLGFASLLAEDGRPMHKSWGNSIEFNEGADKIGVDVMRWMFASQNPTDNLLFGFSKADETRRRFHITLWNIYNFFVTYANIVGWFPTKKYKTTTSKHILDQWILIRLNQTISIVTKSLDKFSANEATKSIEEFVSDLSLWYVRRSRERLAINNSDLSDREACFATLYTILIQLTQILAPFTPFIAEEIYRNLTQEESVHLSKWPKVIKADTQADLILSQMDTARKLVEIGLSQRKDTQIKVRQPLRTVTIGLKSGSLDPQITKLILTELNIKDVIWQTTENLTLSIDTNLDPELIAEGRIREMARSIQDKRKELGALLNQQIDVVLPSDSVKDCPTALVDDLKKKTLIRTLSLGETLLVSLVDNES